MTSRGREALGGVLESKAQALIAHPGLLPSVLTSLSTLSGHCTLCKTISSRPVTTAEHRDNSGEVQEFPVRLQHLCLTIARAFSSDVYNPLQNGMLLFHRPTGHWCPKLRRQLRPVLRVFLLFLSVIQQ